MSRRLLPALVACCAMALPACGSDDDGSAASSPELEPGTVPADVDDQPPYGPGAEVGEPYDYELCTHFGIEWARIDGVWWRTTRLDDGNANPPPGWDNPHDAGELLLLDDTTAVFRGGPDVEVEFERTDISEAPFVCD